MTSQVDCQPEYHFWASTRFLGKQDVMKNTGHPERICGWLQTKIRPCTKHQTSDLIWYGSCPDCWANYEHDNDWQWDF